MMAESHSSALPCYSSAPLQTTVVCHHTNNTKYTCTAPGAHALHQVHMHLPETVFSALVHCSSTLWCGFVAEVHFVFFTCIKQTGEHHVKGMKCDRKRSSQWQEMWQEKISQCHEMWQGKVSQCHEMWQEKRPSQWHEMWQKKIKWMTWYVTGKDLVNDKKYDRKRSNQYHEMYIKLKCNNGSDDYMNASNGRKNKHNWREQLMS